MTKHEFMKMLFLAQKTARELSEDTIALCRQIDRLVEAFYADNIDIPPHHFTFDKNTGKISIEEGDNAQDNY